MLETFLGSSLKVSGKLCLPSEIFGILKKVFGKCLEMFVWPEKSLREVWTIFVNLQEVVGNRQKISNMLLSVYFTCIINKIINDFL